MSDRILEIKQPLNVTLGMRHKPELVLGVTELNKLQAVVKLMRIFLKFSTILGGDKYVTMLYLKVMVIKIKDYIQETPSDSQMIKAMKEAMRDNLRLRYTSKEQQTMLDISSVLDVRFKNRLYNSSASVKENMLLEAIVEARHQPNMASIQFLIGPTVKT